LGQGNSRLRDVAGRYIEGVNLTVELDREIDGRWIADVPELNILVYGETSDAAIEAAESAAREIVGDRIAPDTPPSTRKPSRGWPNRV